jgi:RND family efflux transporter MFP subunit
MKVAMRVAFLACCMTFTYIAGSWSRNSSHGNADSETKAAFYACPMHPSFRSDHPGVAPCCGMQLEPVYSNGAAADESADLPAGIIHVSSDRQQLIGVCTDTVKKSSQNQALRITGRVAADDTRIFKIKAAEGGWIRQVYGNSVGSLVKKDQPLASYFATPVVQGAQLSYINAMNLVAQNPFSNGDLPGQFTSSDYRIQTAEDALRNLGMGEAQIKELAKTRKPTRDVVISAPETGFVAVREVTPGQRFEQGEELYRILDIRKVWIIADLFENEASHFKPGAAALVYHPQLHKKYQAQVSKVLPQFNTVTRTLQVRLESPNPNYDLRPDMFVDIEFPLNLPPSISIPAEAIVDTGFSKTVFVDRGKGMFEPRKVETGSRFNGQVEIQSGLMEGERIVVSGNFLIDSESRMGKTASQYQNTSAPKGNKDHSESAPDPVCGMTVQVAKTAPKSIYDGKTYYFCSESCKRKFDKDPKSYIKKESSSAGTAMSTHEGGEGYHSSEAPEAMDKHSKKALDLVCGMSVETAKAAGESVYKGKTYYFCSDICKRKFDSNPENYIKKGSSSEK